MATYVQKVTLNSIPTEILQQILFEYLRAYEHPFSDFVIKPSPKKRIQTEPAKPSDELKEDSLVAGNNEAHGQNEEEVASRLSKMSNEPHESIRLPVEEYGLKASSLPTGIEHPRATIDRVNWPCIAKCKELRAEAIEHAEALCTGIENIRSTHRRFDPILLEVLPRLYTELYKSYETTMAVWDDSVQSYMGLQYVGRAFNMIAIGDDVDLWYTTSVRAILEAGDDLCKARQIALGYEHTLWSLKDFIDSIWGSNITESWSTLKPHLSDAPDAAKAMIALASRDGDPSGFVGACKRKTFKEIDDLKLQVGVRDIQVEESPMQEKPESSFKKQYDDFLSGHDVT